MALDIKVIVSAIDRLTGPMGTMSDSMKGFQNAGKWMMAGGAAINTGLLLAVKSAAKVGEEYQRVSDKTGIAASTLTALGYAAQRSEVPFERMQQGLAKMSRAAWEATQGNKDAVESFRQVGVSVTDSAGKLKDPKQLFLEVADGIAKIENPTQRMALAMKIFSRSGADLIPMLSQGSKGIEELMKRGEKFGQVWSNEAVAAADEFTHSLDDLKLAVGVTGKGIGMALFAPLSKLSQFLAAGAGWVANFTAHHQALTVVGVGVAGVLGLILSILGPLLFLLPALAKTWELVSGALTLTKLASYGMKLEMIAGGIATRAAGLYATVAAGGFTGLAASIWAVAWPVLAVTAIVLGLVGAVRLAVKLFDDVKKGKWGEALKDAAKGMWIGTEVGEGIKQVMDLVKQIKGMGGGGEAGYIKGRMRDTAAAEGAGAAGGAAAGGAAAGEPSDYEKSRADYESGLQKAAGLALGRALSASELKPMMDRWAKDQKDAASEQLKIAMMGKAAGEDAAKSAAKITTEAATVAAKTTTDAAKAAVATAAAPKLGAFGFPLTPSQQEAENAKQAEHDYIQRRMKGVEGGAGAAAISPAQAMIADIIAKNTRRLRSAITTAAGFDFSRSGNVGSGWEGAPETPEQRLQRAYSRYDMPGSGVAPVRPTRWAGEYAVDQPGGGSRNERMTPEQALLRMQSMQAARDAGGGSTIHYSPTYHVNASGLSKTDAEAAMRKTAADAEATFRRRYKKASAQQGRHPAWQG